MAVTIHDTPQAYTPSDNPVNWTFSSDKTAEPNFVYVIAVYIDNVLRANELIFPDSGIYGRFNASSYASNAAQIPSITDDLYTDANNDARIRIDVTERYGEPAIDKASAAASNVVVFKARLEDADFVDWDYTLYLATAGPALWLSNFPGGGATGERPLLRRTLEQFRIMAITNLSSVSFFTIELYDADDVLVVSVVTATVTGTNRLTIFNLTPEVVIAATAITQANYTDAAYMKFFGTGDLVPYYVDLNDNCKYTHYRRVHFLTELGTIESLSFDLLSKESSKIKSNGYRKHFGEWTTSAFNYTKEQGRNIDFAKTSERQMVIESDWLNEDVQHWLVRNLYESPLVYLEQVEGASTILLRRRILNTAWVDDYHENDLVFKERITLQLPSKTSMIV